MNIHAIRTKLKDILSIADSIDFPGDKFLIYINCSYTAFTRLKDNELLSYFSENSCFLDIDSRTYHNFDDLPLNGQCVSIGFNLEPIRVHAYNQEKDLCYSMINSINCGIEPLKDENCLYIIGKQIYNKSELLGSFKNIRNVLDCNEIMKAFRKLADYDNGEIFIIIGGEKNLVQYSNNIRLESICDVSKYKEAFIEASQNINSEIRQLLKSEINNQAGYKRTEKERTDEVFVSISTIMDDFQVVRSNYLRNFDSQNIRLNFNKKENDYFVAIKNSLQNLKSELIIFLSAFFAMSEIYRSDNMILSILVVIALLVTGGICSSLLKSDYKQLKIIKKNINHEILQLNTINDKENTPVLELIGDFEKLKKSASSNSKLLCMAMIASFLPFFMSLIVILCSCRIDSETDVINLSINFI